MHLIPGFITHGRYPVAATLLLATLCSAASSQSPDRAEKATLSVALDRTAYAAGSVAVVTARMDIEAGWHTNSSQPTFDYLIATKVDVEVPEGWSAPQVDYPPGEMKRFAFADQPISVYEGSQTFPSNLSIPIGAEEGEWLLETSLTYQACDDRSCLPPVTTSAQTSLRVGPDGAPTGESASLHARPSSPDQTGRWVSLPVMLLLGILGGLILNAMPCVLPVLSLKLFGLVKSAGQGRSQVVVGGLATALGILISFWALALAAVLAKSAGGAVGWGVQFQEPVFVTILAIIVLLFCLNLWGVFEILLPGRLARLADSGPKEGIPGHLVSGLFATLMATPCSAPFLGTAVGFALTQNALTIFLVFTAIAVGMALPYLLLAAFPGATRWLPRPGPWMQRLRVAMGFLLAAAAVWLFYVLAAQMGRERLAFIELALLAMSLFVWMRHQAANRTPWRTLALIGILVMMTTAIVLAAGATDPGESTLDNTPAETLIPWTAFDRQEAEELAGQGRLVFVDVTADWCFTCKVNERLVLETDEVAAAFERHSVIPLKADWTNRSDAITDFLADHGRYGIPFYLLYRPGQEPYVFSELLNQGEVLEVIEAAAAVTSR